MVGFVVLNLRTNINAVEQVPPCVLRGPAASGNLLEMQTIGPCMRPTESQILGEESCNLCFNNSPVFLFQLMLITSGVQ